MANNYFQFKQFTIQQDKCAMKVGTDAVLLGAWACVKNAKRVLDIGTGTGIIALMVAQRSEAIVDAIDIDKNSYLQSCENIQSSKWNNRIFSHFSSLQDYIHEAPETYDLIVSNPPYFIDSSKSSQAKRTTARHADLLSYEHLLNGVKQLLKEGGKFCVILPSKEGEIFRDIALKHKLQLSRLTRVRTREDKATEKRWLMCFETNPKTFNEDWLTIECNERHVYTEAYQNLTQEFYLNM